MSHFCLLGSKISVVWAISAIVMKQQIMQRKKKERRTDHTKELANLMGRAAGPHSVTQVCEELVLPLLLLSASESVTGRT